MQVKVFKFSLVQSSFQDIVWNTTVKDDFDLNDRFKRCTFQIFIVDLHEPVWRTIEASGS